MKNTAQHEGKVHIAAASAAADLARRCTGCGLCRRDCAFLQQYGFPGEIAAHALRDPEWGRVAAFSCSLCGLCTAVCPVGVDPARMFLDFRVECIKSNGGDCADYRRLLDYERRGTSRRYTWYALPEQCRSVFFPGCTLPGTRPAATLELYRLLREDDPAMGIVLDCCTKPSHDLGRQEYFQAMFSELRSYLVSEGVRQVVLACPNCYRVFSKYGGDLEVISVYERLAPRYQTPVANLAGVVTVHDPCVVRQEGRMHDAVRQMITSQGLTIREMEHSREKTLCCGEGGAVGCIRDDFPGKWGGRRRIEADGDRIITYCAGCAGMLGRRTPTSHLVDLLLAPEAALAGTVRVARAPFTYRNRLRLKKTLRQQAGGLAPGNGHVPRAHRLARRQWCSNCSFW